MKLEEYNKKRNFSSTNEPVGKTQETTSLRFVVQLHHARAKHYDFRLEWKGVLISFAVPKNLSKQVGTKRLAIHVEDHPVSYINFEGTIPKGNYGAGTVEIYDSGSYFPNINLDEGFKKGNFKVNLQGQKFKGCWNFSKMDEKNWLAIKCKNNFETSFVKAKKNPFGFVPVCLATLTTNVPEGKNWIYEVKFDGYRALCVCENNKVKIFSRNGKNFTAKFSSIASSLEKLCTNSSFVVDGEIVCLDKKGRSSFELLQSEIKTGGGNFCYVVFDILAFNGKDLRNQKLFERKEILEKLMKNCEKNLVFSEIIKESGKKTFEIAKKLGLEGIVAKEINSLYTGERTKFWLKIKARKSQEFVVGGITTTQKNQTLSSILVGFFENGKFVFAGKVGTGFNEETKQSLAKILLKNKTKTCPFENDCKVNESVVWVKPKLVVQVEFASLTSKNLLRQASFVGIREDKKPSDVVLER